MGFSQSQLTQLGNRLKVGVTADDLRMLDEYRRSFAPACDVVTSTVKTVLGLHPTVRSAKSTQAIIEKLKRQSSRLGQIQDIAGCRLNVSSMRAQDEVVAQLQAQFQECRVDDRRKIPSNSYRAVHVIAKSGDRWIEIQVRTELQNSWATLSEKLADVYGNCIKYGFGNTQVLEILHAVADGFAAIEHTEQRLDQAMQILTDESDVDDASLVSLGLTLDQIRRDLTNSMQLASTGLAMLKELS